MCKLSWSLILIFPVFFLNSCSHPPRPVLNPSMHGQVPKLILGTWVHESSGPRGGGIITMTFTKSNRILKSVKLQLKNGSSVARLPELQTEGNWKTFADRLYITNEHVVSGERNKVMIDTNLIIEKLTQNELHIRTENAKEAVIYIRSPY